MTLISPHREAGIAIYTGLPGGGKSYQASCLQVEWLESGNPVLSNLEIRALPWRMLKPKYGVFVLLSDEDFKEFDQVLDKDGNVMYEEWLDEKGKKHREPLLELRLMKKLRAVLEKYPGRHPLVLIDEAPNYYASQDFKSNPRAMKSFLRQHRHLGVSVVAVAQNHGMLDNNFNRLCQEYRHHKNLVKDSKLEIILWWFGDNFHLAYSMANAGGKPFTREIYGRKWFRIKKQRASFYNTTQMHASDLPGQLRRARNKSLRLVLGFLFAAFICVAFVLVWKIVVPHTPVKNASSAVVSASVEQLGNLEAVYIDGKNLVFVATDNNGQSRVVTRPYSGQLSDFYDLSEKVGQQVKLPPLPTRPMAEVFND